MQGFNMGRYYPPSEDKPPTFNSSAPKKSGPQVVRFEMPFHIWCGNCPKPTIIPQGVRFNAEKKRVGMYYSTPIWSFRMRHTVCGKWFEIRTDPQHSEYVVHEGGKRRDYGEDKDDSGEILTQEEKDKRRNDAFANLEGKVTDKTQAKQDRDRILDLQEAREKDWADPFAVSQKLRKAFRAERKVRVQKEADTEALKDRFGLGIDLLAENEADKTRAGLIEFGKTSGDLTVDSDKATRTPLFQAELTALEKTTSKDTRSKTKKQIAAEKSRISLQQDLRGNTHAAMDPFTQRNISSWTTPKVLGIKRKRTEEDTPKNHALPTLTKAPLEEKPSEAPKPSLGLADYDSD